MFDGAKMILPEISGKYIDPLSLLRGQMKTRKGFIMVSYGTGRHQVQSVCGVRNRPAVFYDLFFFTSWGAVDFARLSPDLRGFMDMRIGLQTFSVRRGEGGTTVRVYSVKKDSLMRFMTTFCCEPSLRIDLEGAGEDGLRELLFSSGCRRGIIEYNLFKPEGPLFRFEDVSSRLQLRTFTPGCAAGRLLLYDLEENAGICGGVFPEDLGMFRTPQYWRPGFSQARGRTVRKVVQDDLFLTPRAAGRRKSRKGRSLPQAKDPPPTGNGSASAQPEDVAGTQMIPGSHTAGTLDDALGEGCKGSGPVEGENEALKPEPEGGGSADPPEKSGIPAAALVPDEYTRQFDRLCRCFKKAVIDCLGSKGRYVIARAEEEVRAVAGGFDSGAMDRDNAVRTLDFIRYTIEGAPLLKRGRLREAGGVLISDLYDRYYDLLQRNGALEEVEKIYYDIKK